MSKLPKVTNFFTAPAAAASSSSSNSNPQPNETEMGCESAEIIQPGLDDVVPPDHKTPASSTLQNETGMDCESSEIIQPGLDDVVPPDHETPASSTLLKLQTHTAIDQVNQNLLSLEVNRWKEVLTRLIAIVNHLAERNLAFRGHSDRLFEPGNGNFLGQVQLMAQFDPIMREHLRRSQAKELSDNYLSKHLQNELISLVAKCTIDAIVEKVKKAKYYAVILDCTPDLSHNEQLSVVLRIVNCETSKGISIHEHFVGFLQALDTTEKGLCESFLGHLETLGLDLSNCRGQSYDNGSNMQASLVCYSDSTLFRSSVHCWSILTEHVKNFTLKALSTTRWESRVEAIKAVRYQLPEIVEALTALKEYAMEKRDAEVVSTAGSICKEMQRWPFVERFSHMETFYELYGFLYSTDVMRSTEKEGKLDERCHRLEQRFDDVDAEDLKLEHHNIEDSSCCCPNLSCVKRAPCLPLPWAPNFLNPPLLAALHEDMPHSLLFLAGFTESIFVFSNF
ncbi:hypothetical protein ABVT39_000756 [Epinephelus coioides]